MCCTMSNYVYSYLVDGNSYGYLYVARASLLGNPPAFFDARQLAVLEWKHMVHNHAHFDFSQYP